MNKKQRRLIVIAFALIVILMLIGLWQYNRSLDRLLSTTTEKTLSEIATQQQFNFDMEIAAEQMSLESIAKTMSRFTQNREIVVDTLAELQQDTKFENMAVTALNGRGVSSENEPIDISSAPYFQDVLQGNTVISEPGPSLLRNSTVITMATPIYQNDDFSGILVGSYNAKFLNQLLLPSFGGRGYAFVIDQKGDIIVSAQIDPSLSGTANLFESWESAQFENRASLDQVMQSIAAKETGMMRYTLGDSSRIAEHLPLSVNDWSLIVSVPTEVIAEDANVISRNATLLAVLIVAGFVLFIFLLLWQQKRHTLAIERIAYYDELTGIPNLYKFKIDANAMLHSHTNQRFCLIKMDIAGFKMINQMFDYATGDRVIQAIADVGRILSEPLFLQARVGTDEFLFFGTFEWFSTLRDDREGYEQLFRERVGFLGGHRVDFRYGRFYLPLSETNIDGAIEKVNLAHRFAKLQKDDLICDYDDSFRQRAVRETELTNKMDAALQSQEFKVYLQPKYEIKNETVIGAEALVRWQESNGNLIMPGDFIPLFERNGFVIKLDFYMLERVCELLQSWLEHDIPIVPISVNFSRLHLANPNFVKEIAAITQPYSILRRHIEIELTESAIFDNEKVLEEILHHLHELGFTVSMDDFGTGYSSLGMLQSLPVDVIKIDRSFFSEEKNMARARSVIRSVMQMAQTLDIYTVAEGVETKDQVDFLREVKCDCVQGFYYAKPVPAAEFRIEKD